MQHRGVPARIHVSLKCQSRSKSTIPSRCRLSPRERAFALMGLALVAGLAPGCTENTRATRAADPTVVDARAAGPTAVVSSESAGGELPSVLQREAAGVLRAAPAEVVLTVDAAMQRIAQEEVQKLTAEWKPESATAIVLDPSSGEVLALVGEGLAQRPITPGTTLQLVTIAAALAEQVVTPNSRVDCEAQQVEFDGRLFADVRAYGQLSVSEVVSFSSNVGTLRVLSSLGGQRLEPWIQRTGMTGTPSLELPGGAPGAVSTQLYAGRTDWENVALGHKIEVPPIQVAAFFAAIANGGSLPRPTLVRSVRGAPNTPSTPTRILEESAARDLRAMLEDAVSGPGATGTGAQIQGVRAAGKSGMSNLGSVASSRTRRTYASFVGFAPAEAPRYVVLIGVLGPQGGVTGGQAAAPAFARLMTRLLNQPRR